MEVEDILDIKARDFLEARKHKDNLKYIVDCLKDPEQCSKAIDMLQVIFMELLKRRTMLVKNSSDGIAENSSNYLTWLRGEYDNVLSTLLDLTSDHTFGDEALNVVFTLLGQEAKFPINAPEKKGYYFPIYRLQNILKKCFASTSVYDVVQKQIEEFTEFIDVVYYFWLSAAKMVPKLKNPGEKQMTRVLSVLRSVPIPQEDDLNDIDEEVLLGYIKNKSKFHPRYAELQMSAEAIWNAIVKWEHKPTTHKLCLILLNEILMNHLPKPILTMDYLMSSLNVGGSISLLALQGIFTLVTQHNIEYPNIYGKLYTFFHPSIFYSQYKSRLYCLTDIFFKSTHLPEAMVASFIKRFARMCLEAPPHDIIILTTFIRNLMVRHPDLKAMIKHPTSKTVENDPFIDDEEDPYKTRAIESSLWELETLMNHVQPKVTAAVNFINKGLPDMECEFVSMLQMSYDDVFEKETKKNMKNVCLTYQKPSTAMAPDTSYLLDLWGGYDHKDSALK